MSALTFKVKHGTAHLGRNFWLLKNSKFQIVDWWLKFENSNCVKENFFLVGNQTYLYPDQAIVSTGTTQFLGHFVERSLHEYVDQQASWVGVETNIAGIFSASADTQWAETVMKDNLHMGSET